MRSIESEWLDLAAELLAQPLRTLPRERLATLLATTFGLPACAFGYYEPGLRVAGQIYPADEHFHGHRPFLEQWLRHNCAHTSPVLRQYLATGTQTLQQVADVPERFADPRVRAVWRSHTAPAGVAEQLLMPLGDDPDPAHLRAFALGRDVAFSEAEVALARRIWRLLRGIDGLVTALRAAEPDAGAAEDLRVTPRELAAIGLLAEGLTASAIGRRMSISERTVHKHLEHAYAKLGVSDRLSAVQRATRLGLLSSSA